MFHNAAITFAITGGGRIEWWEASDVGFGCIGVVSAITVFWILMLTFGARAHHYGAASAIVATFAWLIGSPSAMFGGERPVYWLFALSMLCILAPSLFILLRPLRMKRHASGALAMSVALLLLWAIDRMNPHRDHYIDCGATWRLLEDGNIELVFTDYGWRNAGPSFVVSSLKLRTYLIHNNPSSVILRVWYPISTLRYTHDRSEIGTVAYIDGIEVNQWGGM